MILYSLTPISQSPEKDGWYIVIDTFDDPCQKEFFREQWIGIAANHINYLRPIPEEELRKLLGDGFDAGWKQCAYNEGASGEYAPDKETYINKILNQQP